MYQMFSGSELDIADGLK